MPITNFWANTPGLVSTQPGWITPSPADLATAPGDLDPVVFRTWARADQIAYIEANGAGSPKSVEIGPALGAVSVSIVPDKALRLQLPQVGNPAVAGKEFGVEGPGRAATASEFAMAPEDLGSTIFLAWRREDQLAYLSRHGGSVTIGGASGSGKIFASLAPDVTLGDGVIQRTSGDYEPIPYFYLNGSSSGMPSAIVQASAEALFPTLNGDDVTLLVQDRPDDFDTMPGDLTDDARKKAFLQSFSTWHSAYQLEYVKMHGTNGVLDIIVTEPPARMTAVVSASDTTRLIIVQALDKNALAQMTLAEQNQIAGLDGFIDVAVRLGLTHIAMPLIPSVIESGTKVTADQAVSELVDYINSQLSQNKTPPSLMPEADRKVFTRQLEILNAQLDTMGVVSPADINTKLVSLKERFDRAFAFWDVKPPTVTTVNMVDPDVDVPAYRDVISLNGDLSGINRGYQIFITQERRICELAEERMQIAGGSGGFSGKTLDAPTLVFMFQNLYSLTLESRVVMETEEINQQNDLLKTYAAMQDLINKVLSRFDKADGDKRTIMGDFDTSGYQFMTNEERALVSMFEEWSGNGQKHPLEKLRNIDRPTHDFWIHEKIESIPIFGDEVVERYGINKFSHTQFSTYATRLSETVTLLNQNSQIKMNEVNTLDKERNRHFELASNALAKAAEIIQNIARAA